MELGVAETFKYRAFLSYSHADSGVAKRVHSRLEGFHIDKDLVGRNTPAGPIPTALRPIFRDRNEFDAGGSLAEQSIIALDDSAALIVLASPNAARSKFVNEELRQFKLRHPDRPVIPLIIDGEPGNPEKECFPPALRLAVAEDGSITDKPIDVLAADLQEKGDGFELALAKVVARLLPLPPDEVYRRTERERRIQRRRTRRMHALIYILLIGSIAGLVGWINQAEIKAQINWFKTMRPYMVAHVRPFVLTADVERMLKPKATFRECEKDCPEMIVVPFGSFPMGSPATEAVSFDNERPQHEVTIARPFAVSKFDVTFAEWDACVSVGGCPQASSSNFGRGTRPVINVSWEDAQQYVAWFSIMTGHTYRLPTEAEWEYSARADKKTAYPWGSEVGKGNADCNGCGSKWDNSITSPVGSFEPNAFGLYDMAGDVWQWVQDCYHDDYNGAPADGSVWTGGDCNRHVVRGGSWYDNPQTARSAYRVGDATVNRNSSLGFRIARTLTP
jgi:formylglycine-generating enzyme required for sulfatase activity